MPQMLSVNVTFTYAVLVLSERPKLQGAAGKAEALHSTTISTARTVAPLPAPARVVRQPHADRTLYLPVCVCM